MSRIYEALKQTDKLQADAVLGSVEELHPSPVIEVSVNRKAAFIPLEVPVTEAVSAAYAPGLPHSPFREIQLRLPGNAPLFPFDGMDTHAAEQYRMLRTNILHHPRHPAMLVITSAGPGDGKTVTALNLAGTLALKNEGQVLLVDGDLRRSALATTLGLDYHIGLADVLRGTCSIEDAIVRVGGLSNLHVLPAGMTTVNPAELLDSNIWTSIATVLRQKFRHIVIDSTPMTAVADFQLVQATCDAVVIVVRPDHTNRKAFASALKAAAKDKLIGVVINALEDWPLAKSETAYDGI